jgi:cephalosporin-C deacetylase-like acetyl esterase
VQRLDVEVQVACCADRCKERLVVKMLVAAMMVSATAAFAAVDWDNAMIKGKTEDGRLFYGPGETITMNLWLEGVDAELPPGEYFVNWERRGDDGKTEKGKVPLPFPEGGLVLKTRMDSPGFVCFEANVVTADGRRVPKNHRWEKRVFFQGGAGVSVESLKAGAEPADYDEFWRSVDEELAKVPVEAEMTPWPCPDRGVRLYAVRIACAGPRPVTGWLTMPADASPERRYPILAASRGASHDNHPAPKKGPHDRIRMEINVNGFDLGRDDAYVKEFFKSIGVKGYGYGFDPETNKSRETSYWKGAAMRAARYLEWLATLKEWDGKTLDAEAGSQGGWMMIMGASRCHKVTRLKTRDTWGCDWTGQAELGRLKSTYRPKCWFPDMAYFDAVFAARRVTCPVEIASAGLGDYVSPPSSLAVLYNNLNVPKSITWYQGHTHGWHPSGMASQTLTANDDPIAYIRGELAAGRSAIKVPKARYRLVPGDGETCYLELRGLSDVAIDFSGSELVGAVRTRMFSLQSCTNVTLRNVSIDYETLPFTQGRIEKVGEDGTWDVRIIDGYPRPSAKAAAAVGNAWPIQAYDGRTLELKNPMRFRDGISLEKTGDDTYRISGGIDRRGDVGDIAVFSCREEGRKTDSSAIMAVRCVNAALENVTVYATPHGPGFYDMLSERPVYRGCRLVPRPPETDIQKRGLRRLRSGNHDAFMSRGAVVGPQIVGCTALYHCDDCVNIGGKYAVVVKAEGRTLRLLADDIAASVAEGDPLQIFAYDGRVLPDVSAASVAPAEGRTAEELEYLKAQGFWPGLAETCSRALTLVLDRDMDVSVGYLVANRRHTGDGFRVKGCHFGRNRARGLILQASDGVVEDNFIDHPFDLGMKISMSHLWLEGTCGSNVRVARNRIEKDGTGTGIYVGGTPGKKGGTVPADSHRNLVFEDNEILDVQTGIRVTGCTGLSLKGNRVRIASPKGRPTVLENVVDVSGLGEEP